MLVRFPSVSNTGAVAHSIFAIVAVRTMADPIQFYVSNSGNDDTGVGSITSPWKTIQKALLTIPFGAGAVDLNLRKGRYILQAGIHIGEQSSGSAEGPFRIRSYDAKKAILDGRLIPEFGAMLSVSGASYVSLEDLEFDNLIGNKSGIYVEGASSHISIAGNKIHNMHWTTNAKAAKAPSPSDNTNPLVMVGNSETPMENVSVMHNDIYNLTTGYSEAVKIVGNVDGFMVEGNNVHNVTNIGIVAAGNYDWVGVSDSNLNQARNGVIRHNNIHNCISPVADSAGIYVDGARNVSIEDNHSYKNTIGFSVGAEQAGAVNGIVLSRNIADKNLHAGIMIGTNTPGARVTDVTITENTFCRNYKKPVFGGAQVIFSNVDNVTVSNNRIESLSEYMVTANGSVSDLKMNCNHYKSRSVDATAAVFAWNGTTGVDYFSFEAFRVATGEDKLSTFNEK